MKRSIICIGASTGGIDALERVLVHFPPDCPPTLVVQHILHGFSGCLARRLDRVTAASVTEATDGTPLQKGRVMIAPASDRHLVVALEDRPTCRLVTLPRNSGHRPSIDTLFSSAASAPLTVVGCLLTGMGRDGAIGLKRIRDTGGRTMAQDEASSVVFGMPRAAAEIEAAEMILPLSSIGPELIRLSGTERGWQAL